MKLAHGFPVPRGFAMVVDDADFHEGQRASRANADFVSFIFRPVTHVRLERGANRDGCRLRHAPDLNQANALLIQLAYYRLRHCRAADKASRAPTALPSTGI